MRFLFKMSSCIILNMAWIIGCIPIITIGASTAAFYHTVTKVIRNDRGYVLPEFWSSFSSNFKQSTVMWLIMVVVYVFAYVDCYYAYLLAEAGHIPKFFFWGLLVIFSLVFMWTSYLLPYVARIENTTREILRNSAFIMFRNILWSIQNFLIFIATVVLILLVPILLVILPVITMILTSMSLERVFRKYMTEEDLEMENLRNCQNEEECV